MKKLFIAMSLIASGCGYGSTDRAQEISGKFSQLSNYSMCIKQRAAELGPPSAVTADEARTTVKKCRKFVRAAAAEIAQQFAGQKNQKHPYGSVEFNMRNLEQQGMSMLSKSVRPLPVV